MTKYQVIAKPHLPTRSLTKEPYPEGKTPALLWGYRAVFDHPDLIAPGEGHFAGMAEVEGCVKEWNQGIVDGLRDRGFIEFHDPFHYMDRAKTSDGTPIDVNTPIVLHLEIETRPSYNEDARKLKELLANCGRLASVEEQRGFLSVFEVDVHPGSNLTSTQVKSWNDGVAKACEYKRIPGKMAEDIQTMSLKSQPKSKESDQKGTTTMSNSNQSTGTGAVESTWNKAKDVLKKDSKEVAYRVMARQANKRTQELIVAQLTKSFKGAEKNKYTKALQAVMETDAGRMLVGGILSLALPQASKIPGMEKYSNHFDKVAEECRLDGMVQLGDNVADLFSSYLGELGSMMKNLVASEESQSQSQTARALNAAPVSQTEEVQEAVVTKEAISVPA